MFSYYLETRMMVFNCIKFLIILPIGPFFSQECAQTQVVILFLNGGHLFYIKKKNGPPNYTIRTCWLRKYIMTKRYHEFNNAFK